MNKKSQFPSPTSGHAGARNCKFLERVVISQAPCIGDANWKQYAVHAPDVTVRKIAEFNLNKFELMGDSPVQARGAHRAPKSLSRWPLGLGTLHLPGAALKQS